MTENYFRDVFYNINKLSFKKIKSLLIESKQICYHWHVDTLNGSARREPIEITFEEALKKCTKNAHYVFIHRKGFENWEWHLEIGYRTMTTPDFFLWINLKQDKIDKLVKKYKLEELI